MCEPASELGTMQEGEVLRRVVIHTGKPVASQESPCANAAQIATAVIAESKVPLGALKLPFWQPIPPSLHGRTGCVCVCGGGAWKADTSSSGLLCLASDLFIKPTTSFLEGHQRSDQKKRINCKAGFANLP
uniref:Uncharacterized protein n=1 Tax=Sphaerodactylus townsendi TaxID=933632 RepID=A0ACB8FYY4_9SAUR